MGETQAVLEEDPNFLLKVAPILKRLEETQIGDVLVQPEVDTLLAFIGGMSKMLDDLGAYAGYLENQLEMRHKKKLWRPNATAT